MFGWWKWRRLIDERLLAAEERINIMAGTQADLDAEVQTLKQAEADTKARVSAAVAALQAEIDDLKQHPAAPDLSAEIAGIQAVVDDLASVAPASSPTP